MGYGNRPTMPNNNYQKGGFNKNYNKKQFNKDDGLKSGFKSVKGSSKDFTQKKQSSPQHFFAKDEEDIYSPKVYSKKPKKKSSFEDIIVPEYEMEKQRMRNKRANDKKYKHKDKWGY